MTTINGPHREKISLRGFLTTQLQTSLISAVTIRFLEGIIFNVLQAKFQASSLSL